MIQGLNGIRAIAVLAVMISHFGEGFSAIYVLNLGHFGVMMFFVLSGFLISRIICREKQKSISISTFLKSFYARRIIRIFPLFYLALLIFHFVGLGFGEYFKWHVTYTSNFLLAKIGSGFFGTHFWSLAVEEQFYLLYPIALFAIPKSNRAKFMFLLLAIGMCSRIYAWNFSPNTNIDRMLWVNFDALALGGLFGTSKMENWKRLLTQLLAFTAPFVVVSILCNNLTNTIHICLLLCFVALIAFVSSNQTSRITHLLESPTLEYIGKISYGLYVWHYLIWQNDSLFMPIHDVLNLIHPKFQFGYSRIISSVLLSFLFSIISWHFFEQPLLNLKRKFQYQ